MNEKVESRTGAAGWSLGLDTTLKLTTTGGGLYDLRRRRDDLRQGLYMNAENYLRMRVGKLRVGGVSARP